MVTFFHPDHFIFVLFFLSFLMFHFRLFLLECYNYFSVAKNKLLLFNSWKQRNMALFSFLLFILSIHGKKMHHHHHFYRCVFLLASKHLYTYLHTFLKHWMMWTVFSEHSVTWLHFVFVNAHFVFFSYKQSSLPCFLYCIWMLPQRKFVYLK